MRRIKLTKTAMNTPTFTSKRSFTSFFCWFLTALLACGSCWAVWEGISSGEGSDNLPFLFFGLVGIAAFGASSWYLRTAGAPIRIADDFLWLANKRLQRNEIKDLFLPPTRVSTTTISLSTVHNGFHNINSKFYLNAPELKANLFAWFLGRDVPSHESPGPAFFEFRAPSLVQHSKEENSFSLPGQQTAMAFKGKWYRSSFFLVPLGMLSLSFVMALQTGSFIFLGVSAPMLLLFFWRGCLDLHFFRLEGQQLLVYNYFLPHFRFRIELNKLSHVERVSQVRQADKLSFATKSFGLHTFGADTLNERDWRGLLSAIRTHLTD